MMQVKAGQAAAQLAGQVAAKKLQEKSDIAISILAPLFCRDRFDEKFGQARILMTPRLSRDELNQLSRLTDQLHEARMRAIRNSQA